MQASEKFAQMAKTREKKELEKFIREIVKDEVNRLLKTKYDSENLLTVSEVKDNYNTSLSTINRYVNSGALLCNQSRSKGKRLFKKADCDLVFLKEKR